MTALFMLLSSRVNESNEVLALSLFFSFSRDVSTGVGNEIIGFSVELPPPLLLLILLLLLLILWPPTCVELRNDEETPKNDNRDDRLELLKYLPPLVLLPLLLPIPFRIEFLKSESRDSRKLEVEVCDDMDCRDGCLLSGLGVEAINGISVVSR